MSRGAAEGSGPDDQEGTAGEYVLGTLPADERAAFAAALAADPALRERVAAWEARLAPLAGATAVSPTPGTWNAIRARIGAHRQSAAASDARVIRLERAARRWRLTAAGAGALAASLAVVLVLGGSPSRLETGGNGRRYVAVVNRGGELPALIVRVDTGTGAVEVRSLGAETPANRSLELWYIGAGAAPRSLGVIAGPNARFPVPAALAGSADGASLAVSVEPEGGSPTGGPTGPVVYSGRLIRD